MLLQLFLCRFDFSAFLALDLLSSGHPTTFHVHLQAAVEVEALLTGFADEILLGRCFPLRFLRFLDCSTSCLILFFVQSFHLGFAVHLPLSDSRFLSTSLSQEPCVKSSSCLRGDQAEHQTPGLPSPEHSYTASHPYGARTHTQEMLSGHAVQHSSGSQLCPNVVVVTHGTRHGAILEFHTRVPGVQLDVRATATFFKELIHPLARTEITVVSESLPPAQTRDVGLVLKCLKI